MPILNDSTCSSVCLFFHAKDASAWRSAKPAFSWMVLSSFDSFDNSELDDLDDLELKNMEPNDLELFSIFYTLPHSFNQL